MKTKSKAVLGLSTLSPESKVIKAQTIIDAMQASGNFPASGMPISYPHLQSLVTGLHQATVLASHGSSADVSDMHEQARLLVMSFNIVKAHVEMLGNTFTNPEAIILSAGMTVAANAGLYAISDLQLEAGGGGTIRIRVPKNPGDKAYWFQYALPSDPDTWHSAGFSTLCRYVFKNQVPGTLLSIRYAAIRRSGLGPFSDPGQVMVV